MSVSFCRRLKDSAGDTIIEVMVVLAVLGSAIGIGFVTANRSLLAVTSSEDNATANQLLQAQLEALRSAAHDSSGAAVPAFFDTTPGAAYCIVGGTLTHVTHSGEYDNGGYPNGCIQSTAPFYISISYADTPTTPTTFTLQAHWSDAAGEGEDSATLVYRLHQ